MLVHFFNYALTLFAYLSKLVCVQCYSLKLIRDNNICLQSLPNKNSTCASNFHNDIEKYLLRNAVNWRNYKGETTREAIYRNPCILTKIALHLNVNNIKIILTKEQNGLLNSVNQCDEVTTGDIKVSLAVIQGDENNFQILKMNLLQILARETKFYAVLCNTVCNSLLMHVAYELGYASSMYVWLTTEQPAFSLKIKYPKKWISINLINKERIQRLPSNWSMENNPIHGSDSISDKSVCQETLLVTSQGKQLLIPCPKDCEIRPQNVISKTENNLYQSSKSLYKFLKVFKKEQIKIVTLLKEVAHFRPDLFNQNDMTCKQGLLCWAFPPGNRSLTSKRVRNCCQGLVIDVLQLLKEDMNVELHLYEVEDGHYGAFTDGRWNGLIGDVVNGNADMAVDLLSVTEARLPFVDYTETYVRCELVVASKMQVLKLNFLNLEVFASICLEFWGLIFGTTLIISLIICWSEKNASCESQSKSWMQVFVYTIGLLVQRDIGGSIPRFLGSRTLSLFMAIAMIIIMSTYVALLVSRNITNEKFLPISGLNDPKIKSPSKSFKIGTWKDSSISQMFERSENPKWRRLGLFMKPYNFNNLSDISTRLQKGAVHGAIIDTISLAEMWKNYRSCDVQFNDVISPDNFAFPLTKGSEWKEPLSYLIRKYQESGKLDAIERKWLASKCPTQTIDLPEKFGLLYLSGACIMIVFGLLLSGAVFILEHIYSRKMRQFSYTLPQKVE